MNQKILYDGYNNPIKAIIPNLDPNFFLPVPGSGNVTTDEMESKPYQYHSWIYSAAKVISSNVSRLPKVLVKKSDPSKFIDEHEVLDAFLSPNAFMPNPVTFWQAVLLSLLLPSNRAGSKGNTGGQVFIVPLKADGGTVDLTKGEIPDILYPFSDKLVSPWHKKEGEKNILVGWIYTSPNNDKEKIKFRHNEIIRINFYNPYDWLRGLSPFAPASIAMTQDISADVYNTTFFNNDATVAGVLTSDQHLTNTQYREYMDRWYDRYGGAGKSNRTAILGAGLKYQQMGQVHRDMQFIEQKNFNREQILATYGLNKIAVGLYEGINFATIREGRRISWQDTFMPIDQQIMSSITVQWVRHIEKGLMIRSDYSEIEALREDYKARAEAGKTMVEGMSFPPALAADLNNIPLTEQNLLEYPWLAEEPKKAAPFGSNDDKDKTLLVKRDFTKNRVLDTEEDRIRLSWDYIHKVLEPGEKDFIKRLHRFFFSQRNRMQDKVDAWLRLQEKLVKVLNISPNMFLFDVLQANEKLSKILKPVVKEQLKREEARLIEELGPLIEWSVTDEKINDFSAQRQEEIKAINTTTFKKARKQLNDAIAKVIKDDASPREAAKLMKEAISNVADTRKNQAMTIARTEIGIISSGARFDAFHVEGIEFHEWLNAADEKVRERHLNKSSGGVGGEVVRVGQTFPVVNMLHPLDPKGDVSDIVNCRCVNIAAEAPTK